LASTEWAAAAGGFFEEEEVAGFGADVEEHGAAFVIGIVVAEGVANGGGGDIDELKAEAGVFGDFEEAFDDVGFDGDEEDFEFAGGGGAKDLVVPNDFIEWKGNVLLGFVLDDLGDFGGVDGGQFDEFGKGVKARGANVDGFGVEAVLGEGFLEGLLEGGLAGAFLKAFLAEGAKAVVG
jgi:hypothetical protein